MCIQQVTTAQLRNEFNQKVADHVKENVGGLTNGMATLAVGKKVQQPAAGGIEIASVADNIAFQKVDGLVDGTVAVLCAHSSTKMLQVTRGGGGTEDGSDDGGSFTINACGALAPSAMFVVVTDDNSGGTIRLQHAEDDACWLRVAQDGAVDGAGDPELEETVFTAVKNGDGTLSLLSAAAGKALTVGKDGVVTLADDGLGDDTKFTIYQRRISA